MQSLARGLALLLLLLACRRRWRDSASELPPRRQRRLRHSLLVLLLAQAEAAKLPGVRSQQAQQEQFWAPACMARQPVAPALLQVTADVGVGAEGAAAEEAAAAALQCPQLQLLRRCEPLAALLLQAAGFGHPAAPSPRLQ